MATVQKRARQMLQFFRNIFKSKIGIGLTLAFLGLIALAFASSDVANTGMFGGVAGSEQVASVGDRSISTSDLSMGASNALNTVRQNNPTMTMEGFIASGGFDNTLEQMITRAAITDYGHRFGLRAGERLVDSEIVNIPEFRGLDGNFNEEGFRSLLTQRGLTESAVRDDFAMGLMAQQVAGAIDIAPRMPRSIAAHYARLLQEQREGRIAAIIAAPFAPEGDPAADVLQAYYQDNRDRYIRPERRVIRYATFSAETLSDLPEPTEAQIAERYENNSAEYAALETRSLTQLVVPTQQAAQAIADEVAGGITLEASATDKGLRTTSLDATTQDDLASATSDAVANAAFAAPSGGLTPPVQGALGWYVLRVDGVDERPARTLDQVRGEIAEALTVEMRRQALNDRTVQIEDDFADGRSLTEVADALNLEIETTDPITAAGLVYGTPERAPAVLGRVVPVAFDMEEGEPQLAETVPGTQFVVFDVSDITESAAAPLAEIRADVAAAWRRDEAMEGAGAAARRIMERVEGGATLADAVAAEEVTLPAPETVSLNRQQIQQGGEVPRALALMFSMAQGTIKPLEAPEAAAWFVVALDNINAPELAAESPLVQMAAGQLAATVGEEYAAQYVGAVRNAVEVSRNQNAIDAVIAQLTGQLN